MRLARSLKNGQVAHPSWTRPNARCSKLQLSSLGAKTWLKLPIILRRPSGFKFLKGRFVGTASSNSIIRKNTSQNWMYHDGKSYTQREWNAYLEEQNSK